MKLALIRPLITEKSMKDAKAGKFTFVVAKHVDKNAIKQEIENYFTVNVVKIMTRVVKGKSKRFGMKRLEKLMPEWKKAVVELKGGQKISAFELGA